jgi:shikimate kinase
MQQILFICGMPGSGKSTLGKRLANKLLYDFQDLDKCIEKHSGLTPAALIQTFGEAHFREIEAEVLRKISLQNSCVVSCGGGTPCFYDNLNWMKEHGTVLFIDVPLVSLIQRILQADGLKKRPLLGENPEDAQKKLPQIWLEREPYFQQIEWWETGLSINIDRLAEKVNALKINEA